MSNGEWVLFLDSDDMLSVNGIEHMVSAVTQNIDLVFCDNNSILSSNKAIIKCKSRTPQYFSRRSCKCYFEEKK